MDETLVLTTNGFVRGRFVRAGPRTKYFSFQGIPYARPPVGPLRFKPPRPAVPWEGVRDATRQGAVSLQKSLLSRLVTGSEDCLFLNVYTPQVPTSNCVGKKAVMVYFHGGGFMIGSGNTDLQGPDYFMEHDIVLVTLNYRLGALGFLQLPSAGIQGNMGLKDQIMALRWVRDNIENFGGDPNKVTIFGESAGSASVQFLMFSEMAKGLFHRAICQSGNAIFRPQRTRRIEERAFLLGQLLGCTTNDPQELADFLRQAPPGEIAEKAMEATFPEERAHFNLFPFGVEIEPEGSSEPAAVERPCLRMLEEGRFTHVPFMIGINSKEGLIFTYNAANDPDFFNRVDENWECLIPLLVYQKLEPGQVKSIAKTIKEYYFADKPVSWDSLNAFVDLKTDSRFTCGAIYSADMKSSQMSAPVYLYEFSFEGQLNISKKLTKAATVPGAAHIDELAYMFKTSFFREKPQTAEKTVIDYFTTLWTNFAKYGNPTPSPTFGVSWPAYTRENRSYLNIDRQLAVRRGLNEERYKFWHELKKRVGLIVECHK